MSRRKQPCRAGTHDEFVEHYEHYLDMVYEPPGPFEPHRYAGRDRLVASIADAIVERGATRIFDCAAGTGFPILDLATVLKGVEIHCTDGDKPMVEVLYERARGFGLAIERLAPKRVPSIGQPSGIDRLILPWSQLNQLEGRYDYVLCRGNSIAYADTWAGRKRVSNDESISIYLENMIRRVRPGGYLHIDAPWDFELAPANHRTHPMGEVWEQVSIDRGRREWWLKIHKASGSISFKRYSSRLTISSLAAMLQSFGLEETEPFQLAGERPGWGVIIARRPPHADGKRRSGARSP